MPATSASATAPRPSTPARYYTADGRLQAIVLRKEPGEAQARKPLPAALQALIDDGIIG